MRAKRVLGGGVHRDPTVAHHTNLAIHNSTGIDRMSSNDLGRSLSQPLVVAIWRGIKGDPRDLRDLHAESTEFCSR